MVVSFCENSSYNWHWFQPNIKPLFAKQVKQNPCTITVARYKPLGPRGPSGPTAPASPVGPGGPATPRSPLGQIPPEQRVFTVMFTPREMNVVSN